MLTITLYNDMLTITQYNDIDDTSLCYNVILKLQKVIKTTDQRNQYFFFISKLDQVYFEHIISVNILFR